MHIPALFIISLLLFGCGALLITSKLSYDAPVFGILGQLDTFIWIVSVGFVICLGLVAGFMLWKAIQLEHARLKKQTPQEWVDDQW